MKVGRVIPIVLVLVTAGCSTVGLGGREPVTHDGLVLRISPQMTADQVVALLKEHHTEVAILSGDRDSAWYADVATRSGLKVTRPGKAGPTTFAFLGPEAIGDTTLTLKVASGGELRVHDALYGVGKDRRLDLMAVHIDSTTNLRDAVRTLLAYIATDVMANAALLLAIEPPRPELGDSVSTLTRAVFGDVWECTAAGKAGTAAPNLPMRVFYGPSARLTCARAERLDAGGGAILGHFIMP